MSEIRLTTLDNGLRVITDHVPSVGSVALGTWIGCGSRHEDPAHNGIAHMVEHMLFKGTKTRSAQQIAEEIENVGGNFNAYTSREITAYYIHLMKEDTGLALDVLADMVQNSALPEEEIERERGVILQEIGMTNDTPDDLIFDHYYETAYRNQPIGASILGTVDIISGMKRAALQNHINTFYTPANTVISAAGNIDHDRFVTQVENAFNALPADRSAEEKPATYKGGEKREEKDLEQTHVIMGFQGLSRHDPAYYDAQALASILGGGLSSRLFQEVREKRGLAYSIFAFHYGYRDTGQFGVYAGTGPDDLSQLMPVLCDEVLAATQNISEEEIARAKSSLKAGIIMGRESMMTRADQQAKFLLQRNAIFAQDDLMEKIENVTVKGIQDSARRIFATPLTLCALGPLGKMPAYDKITEKLVA